MPALSLTQRRAGLELGSRSAVADSKQTLICAWLSAVLLVGLGLNSLFGWTWADPLAALVIAGWAVREGLEAWRGDPCVSGGHHDDEGDCCDDDADDDDDHATGSEAGGCCGGCTAG